MDGRLKRSNKGFLVLEPLTLENYRVPKLEMSINLDISIKSYFTNMNTHKVIFIISIMQTIILLYFFLLSDNRNSFNRVA